MRWFKNLKTRSKMLLGFGLMLALLLGLAFSAYRALATIQRVEREEVSDSHNALVASLRIRSHQNHIRANMLEILNSEDAQTNAGAREEIAARADEIDQLVQTVREFVVRQAGEEDDKLVEELLSAVRAYREGRTEQFRLIASGKQKEALQLGTTTQMVKFDRIREILDTLGRLMTAHANQAVETSKQTFAEAMRNMATLSIVAVLAAVALTWSLTSLIATPLQGAQEFARKLAAGDLTGSMEGDDRNDEVGRLLQAMRELSETVKRLVADANLLTRAAVEGRLATRADASKHQGDFRKIVEGVDATLDAVIGPLNAAARCVDQISKGTIPARITDIYHGDFNTIKDNLNVCIDTVNRLVADANLLNQAALAGRFETRADTSQHQGDFRKIVEGVNATLDTVMRKNQEQDWFKSNLARFATMLQGQRDLHAACRTTLSELAPLVEAQHGVIFANEAVEGQPTFKLLASYAYRERKQVANQFKLGEGLVGQCALERERILLTQVPGDYVKIGSGLGEGTPLNIIVLPVIFEDTVKAVIELAALRRFSDLQLAFLDELAKSLGVVINNIQTGMRTEELLHQSQTLAEELQTQQEELKQTNEELSEKTNELQASEELLKQQAEELRQTNEELEEKARLMATQKAEVERKNSEVEQARMALQEKAEQLALTSKYKSEFLANMSHELRTPLNSLLILSRQLSDNPDANLSAKQVEYARTIHSCGADLLGLINDILDLSKIESGKMEIEESDVPFSDLTDFVERTFRHLAQQKGLEFVVTLDPALPPTLCTEARRLHQVLKNLLSNAFKFTDRGRVELTMRPVTQGWSPDHAGLMAARAVVAFVCRDTGIGIPKDKQQIVFEAFQQADGTTSRKYGGTGLGLSISREIARILGGEIRLVSAPGEGSTFTLYLPLEFRPVPESDRAGLRAAAAPLPPAPHSPPPPPTPVAAAAPVDTEPPLDIQPGELVLLIVEDDPIFADIVADLGREKGFRPLIAPTIQKALALLREAKPAAITLDLHLPDGDGWVLLDRLKHDPGTGHIPVHVISVEAEAERGLSMGALSVLTKPTSKEILEKALADTRDYLQRTVKKLLVVEDNAASRDAIVALIGNGDVETTAVGSGAEALAALAGQHFDCLVLDLNLPDMSGFALLDQIKARPDYRGLPIIIYTGRELTRKELGDLRRYSEAVIVKDVKAPDRLLEETALFLHRVQTRLPESKQRMLRELRHADPGLAGRKVLVVDDDVRNLFALSSVLEQHRAHVLHAESGQECLDLLARTPDVDAVLMDIMMPDLDGYETTRRIRANPAFKKLPILAVTAKAMRGDRDKCLAAGANDYITKPVDTDQLLSLLRVWLYR